jgi:hypothetical protein
MNLIKWSVVLSGTMALSACGGGGSATTTPPPTSNDPTWTSGVFQAESTFKDKCAVPRTGTNPATGNAFPDQAGSILFENHWLRSWSDNTYLWYNEIADQDPANFTDVLSYFDVLRTTATTASGAPRDQFHFTFDSAEYQQLVSSGASAGYGADFTLISASVPRDIRIAFVEPNSPASSAPANLARGAEILEIDGVSVINGGTQSDVDTLNAGLFPEGAGETHTFMVRDIGGTIRTFDIVSEIVTTEPVNVASTMDIAGERVGYLHFTTFGTASAEEAVVNAMTDFANDGVTELVLDLRYNGGGFLDIAAELGFMISGPGPSAGKDFDNLVFNDKHPVTNPVTGQTLSPTPFYDISQGFSGPANQALPALNLSRVFILSTDGTCSASEAVINGLRGIDVEVVLIGTSTCGKPYGFYATDNCGTTFFTIQFRGENDKGFGDYADGFSPINTTGTVGEVIPGCSVADDFSKQLGDVTEGQFAAALSYMQTGTCPVMAAPPPASKSVKAKVPLEDTTSLYNSERVRTRLLIEQSLILTPPAKRD